MRSKKLLALAVTGVLATGAAVATSFEGRLVCDQDPRFASSASCVLDAARSGESGAFGWSEPIHLTYYGQGQGQGTDDWISLAMSEPVYATEYSVSQEGSDPLAGFEWVLGPELVGYYLTPDTYYVTDASTGDVIVIYSMG